jgi:hypothetical protein
VRQRRCVAETTAFRAGQMRRGEIWHIVPPGSDIDDAATWCPIACSTETGIVMPGPIVVREPTCDDCINGRIG